MNADRCWRARVTGLLPPGAAVEVDTWGGAKTGLSRYRPDLVLAATYDLQALLTTMADWHAVVTAAVLGPTSDGNTLSLLVGAAAGGQLFHALDEDLEDVALQRELLRLLHLRSTYRSTATEGLRASFELDGTQHRCRLIDLSNHGCALLLTPQVAPERFLAGTMVRHLVVQRRGQNVMQAPRARVRGCELVGPSQSRSPPQMQRQPQSDFRVRLELDETCPDVEAEEGIQIRGFIRIAALFRRAKRRGSPLVLRHADEQRAFGYAAVVGIDLPGRRIRLRRMRGNAKAGLKVAVHDVLYVTCELGGVAYGGHVSVVANNGGLLTIAAPKAVWLQHRRTLVRFRPDEKRGFAVSFRSPLSRQPIIRPVLDIQPWGLSFAFDAASEVFPVGMVLDAIVLLAPNGARLSCQGVVKGLSPLVSERFGLHLPYRCGVSLTQTPESTRRVVVEEFIRHRCPNAVDGTKVPFERVWRLMAQAGSYFPQYPKQVGPHLKPLAAVHEKLARAEHGLAQSLLYEERGGEALAHAAGLRVYSRTWMLQHLGARSGAPRKAAVARELATCIVENVEASDDIDYVRCVWRGGNAWVQRMTALLARVIANGALSIVRPLNYLRLPASATAPQGWSSSSWRRQHRAPIFITRANPGQYAQVAKSLRQRCHVVRLRAEDLSAEELGLNTLGARFADNGFFRHREVFLARSQEELLAVALAEAATPGLSWAELTNAFTIEVLAPDHPAIDIAYQGLVAQCVAHSREYNTPAVALVEDNQVPHLLAAGFESLGRVFQWTFHRRAVRVWYNVVCATMEPRMESSTHEKGSR